MSDIIREPTLIEAVREFLATCPYMENLGRIGVDFLTESGNQFSIEQTPSEPVIRSYVDGSTERQMTFTFAGRFLWTEEAQTNIDNSGFFEHFQQWLEMKTDSDDLPDLGTHRKALSLEALSSGYLYGIAENLRTARYNISCRLTYYMEDLKEDAD